MSLNNENQVLIIKFLSVGTEICLILGVGLLVCGLIPSYCFNSWIDHDNEFVAPFSIFEFSLKSDPTNIIPLIQFKVIVIIVVLYIVACEVMTSFSQRYL